MKHRYRFGLIAISVAGVLGTHAHAATEAEERAKRQLALLQQKLDTLQQSVAEQDKALRDANRRNVELMKELNSAKTVIRWIGSNPAAVKKIAEETTASEAGAHLEPAAETASSASADTVAGPAGGESTAPATDSGSRPAAEVAVRQPPASAPENKVAVPAAVATPQAAEPVWTDPLYLGGTAAIVGAGLAWAMTRRRRKDQTPLFEDSLLAHNPPTKHVVIGSTGGAVIDTTLAMNSMLKDEDLGDAAFDPSNIDPVAEAEVYLAYGRDSQAEEILVDALSKMPSRQDVRLKLLDIYAARGDLRSFENTLVEMRSIGINKGDSIWQRVVELSAGFGPKNPLVDAEPVAAAEPAPSAEKRMEISAPKLPTANPDDIELELVAGLKPQATDDFDRTASGLNPLLPEVDLRKEVLAETTPKLDLPDEHFSAVPDLSAPSVAEVAVSAPKIDPDTLLNFDFEFDAVGMAPAVGDAQNDADEETEGQAAEVKLDFGEINLDLAAEPAAGANALGEEPQIILEIDDLPEEDPIDIKISLAKAYMEMGDRDSANEILQEVLDEGNATQGKLARELLEEMRSAV